MKKFRTLVEEHDSSYLGLRVDGEALTVRIKQAKHNDLMELSFEGTRVLSQLKSVEHLKGEYREEDWDSIEKTYTNVTKKYSAEIDKLVHTFEKDLNKLVIAMQKDLGKFK